MVKKESEILAEKLFEFNLNLSNWGAGSYDKEFNKNGRGKYCLSVRQFHILFITYKFGFSTVSQYQNIMGISKSSLSLTVSKLVQDGYLRREQPQKDDDGRKVYLYITEKGQVAAEEVMKRLIDFFCHFYDSLDEQKKEDLKIGIEKLNHVFH